MSSGILLFITLAITGGLIAYAGDNIGRQVGRKHWKLFTLRPKHTGTIVTTIFGIVMIGAVMGLLYAFDGEFRGAVNNEASQWQQKFNVASGEVERERVGLARQKAELQQLTARNTDLRIEQKQIQERLTVAQRNLEDRQAHLKVAQQTLELRQARLANLNRQERQLKVRIASLNRENQQLRTEGHQLIASQRTLTQEITRLAWKVHSAKTSALAARTGEILLNAEAPGGQPVGRSQQLIAKTLSILDKQSPAQSAHGKISIPASDVEAAVKALQQPGHYLIQVIAANNAGPNEPLSVRLSVQPQQQATVDIASDILERNRLQGNHLQERMAQQRPAVPVASNSVSLSSEDRKSLLDVIQQLSQATAPGTVQSKVLDNPDLGGPLHLRLDTSNAPE